MSDVRWYATGPIDELAAECADVVLTRGSSRGGNVRSEVARLIADVRERGDEALRAQVRTFDRVELTSIEVPRAAWKEAHGRIGRDVASALARAARNIADAHRAALPRASETTTADGVVIGRRPDPLDRAGVYAPGGRAVYPSSVLMGVVPARVAGVREVIVCSPPSASGTPSDLILAAADIGGADRLFACGGAGAIAAMAYGTATIPRVDRIVGPGNAYVAEAKLQVVESVAIDSPAGPSELLVLGDGTASVERVALELLAQAEHDPDAAVVVVSTDAAWADAVAAETLRAMERTDRRSVIAQSIAARGAVLSANDRDAAIAFSNAYAPEHLLLAVAAPDEWLPSLRNAGTIFLGAGASVAFGDYMSGANHVLPTAGLARAYSGLNVLDFFRWTTYQRIDAAAASRLAGDTSTLANAEFLSAHAEAARAAGAQ